MPIGRLLPRLIAVLFLIDAGARFVPQDRLCFRAWECMTRFQEPGAIFQANRQFRSARTHGNMANLGNLPELRQYRPQVFTTDAYGFRNAPALRDMPIDGVVLGDSYVAGDGNSDADTLPVQLSAVWPGHFYNAGGPYAYAATASRLKTRLHMEGKFAVVVWTENVPLGLFAAADRSAEAPDRRTRLLDLVTFGRGERVRSELRGFWYVSPVKIAAQKAYLAISNDRILPNIYAQRVTVRRLTTGATMIFDPPDVDAFNHPADPAPAAEYLTRLSAQLKAAGFEPLIALAPSKYTVYRGMLDDEAGHGVDADPQFGPLSDLLRSRGVTAVDLTPALQAQARRDLPQAQYLYWLDDTHWNARGIRVAAELIARQLNAASRGEGKVTTNYGI